ncbi:MAG: cytochrome c biogenesis ATP-binding export protein CcmA [Candidatus Pelagibacterales bacterium]|nr:MAG: cytochrome c biogenesis ATP-binding export protein CcmA [Pelagibacterales bacterium]
MNELKTENLSCKRGENIVLNNINFSIKSGETLVVKGRNGSGKTTLLRILSNFITSYEGKVLFNDLGISEDNLYNSKFNLIGQKNSLKENLSIKKNLELWDILFNETLDHTKLLEHDNLDHLINRDVGSLSDGQKKCISLHRLNYNKYEFWFLDEPFVYLDEVNTNSLIEKINRFNENMGIVILTSNINLPKKFHKEINI